MFLGTCMFFSASQHNLERGPINPLQIGVINLGWVVWLNWWNRLWFGMLTLCICWWVWYKKAGINGWESLQHCLKINEYHEWNATGVLEIWELKILGKNCYVWKNHGNFHHSFLSDLNADYCIWLAKLSWVVI